MTQSSMRDDLKTISSSNIGAIFDKFVKGSHSGHLSFEEHSDLLDEIADQFNDVVFSFEIG